MVLNKKLIINSTFTGTDCNLSAMGTFQIIQDAITEMTGLNKIDGVTIKQKYNAFWVFTKTRAKFIKNIFWNSEVSVKCYISSISTIRMNAEVEIRNADGELAMHSKTEMCAIDFLSQKIKKLSEIGVEENMYFNNLSDEIQFTKFVNIDIPFKESVQVKSSNIDFSHHTNNLEYIRFIMNTYSVAELEAKKIKEMEILYTSQSYEFDMLDIKKVNLDNKDLIVIEKEEKPVVKCEILY